MLAVRPFKKPELLSRITRGKYDIVKCTFCTFFVYAHFSWIFSFGKTVLFSTVVLTLEERYCQPPVLAPPSSTIAISRIQSTLANPYNRHNNHVLTSRRASYIEYSLYKVTLT